MTSKPDAQSVKLNLVHSLIRQPQAIVFPGVSRIDKKIFAFDHEDALSTVIQDVNKLVNEWVSNQNISEPKLPELNLYEKTVNAFCIQFYTLKWNYTNKRTYDNVMAYTELLCLHISYDMHEFFDFDGSKIYKGITLITDYLAPNQMETNSFLTGVFDEYEEKRNTWHLTIKQNMEKITNDLKEVLMSYNVNEYQEQSDNLIIPGLCDFAISIIRNKRYHINWV
jgi:hypothetical protein